MDDFHALTLTMSRGSGMLKSEGEARGLNIFQRDLSSVHALAKFKLIYNDIFTKIGIYTMYHHTACISSLLICQKGVGLHLPSVVGSPSLNQEILHVLQNPLYSFTKYLFVALMYTPPSIDSNSQLSVLTAIISNRYPSNVNAVNPTNRRFSNNAAFAIESEY